MDTATIAIITSFLTSIAVLLVQVIQSRQERLEKRRIAKVDFLRELLRALLQARGEYEELISENPASYSDYGRNHARIMGVAISTVLAAGDETLTEIGIKRMTTNMVRAKDNAEEVQLYGEYPTRNRNALTEAVILLGKLISKEVTITT